MNNDEREKQDKDAKENARPKNAPATKPGVTAVAAEETARLDQRIEEKIKGTSPPQLAPAGSEQFDSKPGAVAMGGRPVNSKAGAPAVYGRDAIESLEDRINAKVRSDQAGTAQAQLESLEDAIAAKTGAARPHTDLSRLDERIASKTAQFASDEAHDDKKMPAYSKRGDYEADANDKKDRGDGTTAGYGAHEVGGMKKDDEFAEKIPDNKLEDDDGFDDSQMRPGGLFDPSDIEYGGYDNDEGLAVAVPVMEEDENVFIPSAVEYDPDAKPPLYHNRRFRLYAALSVFIVVVLAVGFGVGMSLSKDDDAGGRSQGALDIEELVTRVIGADLLEDPLSPYSKALRWVAYSDPMALTPDDPNLMQRYIAAYFYYATSESRPWGSCNPPEEGEDELCEYMRLMMIAPELVRSPVPGSVRWLSQEPECKWVGMFCDEFSQIRSIDLNGMNFTGSFPEGLHHLPFLQTLAIGYGEIKGTLPTEIAKFKHLINFEVHYNLMTGSIPSELFATRNLQRLNLAGNLLEGSIQSSIARLGDLKGLYLFENLLTGPIPSEIGTMKSLTFIRAQRNQLNGTIPSELANIQLMDTLWLHENDFSGTLPSELGSAMLLGDLRVHSNGKLGGDIPEEIYRNGFWRYDFYNCNFTGTLSSKIGEISSLITFRAQNNRFSGAIPSNVNALTNLQTFSVSGNDLTGPVPEELCGLRSASVLVELEADCLAEGGEAENVCSEGCCTLCCDATGTNCLAA
ncbi:hypothetical protein FisN_22Lh117 [Fistulifera solaris]|uniref:L domain-like protein n=1 Tax=Fistulifera solaris TaxID=1519565 RepID=A0A1Z5JC17_FISSO|nr:hypothetical protein FisN_22Lh117 [Fistulifera solaris]|eukprot:GAX11432.1 hypothetical protein FisN_22Lh117 [Fistulifera solaris]